MPSFKIKVKWGKEVYTDVEVNTDEEPMVFKAQLFALTGVQPERQKVMLKGAILDQSWDKVKIKDGIMMLMMGTKDEDMPAQPVEKTKFLEDMDERELSRAMDMPAGLQVGFNFCASLINKLNHIFSSESGQHLLSERHRSVSEDSTRAKKAAHKVGT